MPSSYLYRTDPKKANKLSIVLIAILVMSLLLGILKKQILDSDKKADRHVYTVGKCEEVNNVYKCQFQYSDSLFIIPVDSFDIIRNINTNYVFVKISNSTELDVRILLDTFPVPTHCNIGEEFDELVEGVYFVRGQ
jgi:hypothetical protein